MAKKTAVRPAFHRIAFTLGRLKKILQRPVEFLIAMLVLTMPNARLTSVLNVRA
jgi:hypothetical protein